MYSHGIGQLLIKKNEFIIADRINWLEISCLLNKRVIFLWGWKSMERDLIL
jgi:hypothetical protein